MNSVCCIEVYGVTFSLRFAVVHFNNFPTSLIAQVEKTTLEIFLFYAEQSGGILKVGGCRYLDAIVVRSGELYVPNSKYAGECQEHIRLLLGHNKI
mgnify:CR=1 FL=1